jgi:hypothetical protein
MRIFYWNNKTLCAAMSVVIFLAGVTSCVRSTKLVIDGGNPPKFGLSGSGSLGTLRIRGPLKQREAEGEDAFLYWSIVNKEGQDHWVKRIGPITYGKVPEGYKQEYPESGEAPPLIEGESYNIRVATADADGVDKFFIIRKGKIEVSDY